MPDLSEHCWSVYDGCLCEYDQGHDGLHACLSPYHEPQFWTTLDADEWWAGERAHIQQTKKGGSDEPVR